MLKGIFLLLLVGAIIERATAQSPKCQNWIKELSQDIANLDFGSIPLPTIMYSGINPNSPGQKYQCLSQSDYSYYLIYTGDTSSMSSTYTGLCIPNICTQDDIETVLQPYNAKVFKINEDYYFDGWAIAGLIATGGWLLLVIVCSIYSSCNESEENQNQIQQSSSKKEAQMKERADQINDSQQQSVVKVPEVHYEVKEISQWKIFNYSAGYQKIFIQSPHKNVMSLVYFLAVLSVTIATEFSYRQQISANYIKAASRLKDIGGLLICNVEIGFCMIVFVLGFKLAEGVGKITTFGELGRYFFTHLLRQWMLLLIMSLGVYFVLNLIDSPLKKVWQLNYGKDCPDIIWEYWFLFRNLQFNSAVCLPWFWLPTAQIIFTLVSIPIIILFRVAKMTTHVLLVALIAASCMTGITILSANNVFWLPQKLFNNTWKYTLRYEANPLVRAAPFFLGLLLGLFVTEGLAKQDTQQIWKKQQKIAKFIRNNSKVQMLMHGIGLIGMLVCFLSLLFILLPQRSPKDSQMNSHLYLVGVPLSFAVCFSIFILPVLWRGKGKLSRFILRILGYYMWNHLAKISFMFYLLSPMVIGFTTFNMQSSIYYNFDPLIVYLLGDLLLIYILSLLSTAAIENQVNNWCAWFQTIVIGPNRRHSVFIIQNY